MWEPDYVTLAQMKVYLGIETLDTADDIAIGYDITAGSRSVDLVCSTLHNGLGAKRQFGLVDSAEARYYTPRWDSKLLAWVVEIDDLSATTGLAIQVAPGNTRSYTETITDYIPRPMNALVHKRVYTQLLINNTSSVQPDYFEDSVKITSDKWGWAAVPSVVIRATFIQTHRINKRRTSPLGKSGSPQKGTQQQLLEDIDPDVIEMLKSYVKLGRTP